MTRASTTQIFGTSYLVGCDFMVSDVFERGRVVGAIQLGIGAFRRKSSSSSGGGIGLISEWGQAQAQATRTAESISIEEDDYDYIDELLNTLGG